LGITRVKRFSGNFCEFTKDSVDLDAESELFDGETCGAGIEQPHVICYRSLLDAVEQLEQRLVFWEEQS